MTMTRQERARKAAQARWAKTTPEERREAMDHTRQGLNEAAQLKRVRTMAANLGYDLVPTDDEGQEAGK